MSVIVKERGPLFGRVVEIVSRAIEDGDVLGAAEQIDAMVWSYAQERIADGMTVERAYDAAEASIRVLQQEIYRLRFEASQRREKP